MDVGILELKRNPENYFAEVEQSSFTPSNIVPGIGWSPDKMLQASMFSCADAHRYRVGTHYELLPVNLSDAKGNSLVMFAAMFGHREVVACLLENRADARAQTLLGISAQQLARMTGAGQGG